MKVILLLVLFASRLAAGDVLTEIEEGALALLMRHSHPSNEVNFSLETAASPVPKNLRTREKLEPLAIKFVRDRLSLIKQDRKNLLSIENADRFLNTFFEQSRKARRILNEAAQAGLSQNVENYLSADCSREDLNRFKEQWVSPNKSDASNIAVSFCRSLIAIGYDDACFDEVLATIAGGQKNTDLLIRILVDDSFSCSEKRIIGHSRRFPAVATKLGLLKLMLTSNRVRSDKDFLELLNAFEERADSKEQFYRVIGAYADKDQLIRLISKEIHSADLLNAIIASNMDDSEFIKKLIYSPNSLEKASALKILLENVIKRQRRGQLSEATIKMLLDQNTVPVTSDQATILRKYLQEIDQLRREFDLEVNMTQQERIDRHILQMLSDPSPFQFNLLNEYRVLTVQGNNEAEIRLGELEAERVLCGLFACRDVLKKVDKTEWPISNEQFVVLRERLAKAIDSRFFFNIVYVPTKQSAANPDTIVFYCRTLLRSANKRFYIASFANNISRAIAPGDLQKILEADKLAGEHSVPKEEINFDSVGKEP